MQMPSDDEFDRMISNALDSLPTKYTERMTNVAIIYADEPSPQQRQKLKLHCNQTLLGLYEGVPLPARGGIQPYLPDKITIFKVPLVLSSNDMNELQENIRHTLWHEMAHYFGLDHKRIHELE
ncbi:metallopeptidase family protein [Candidatus Saccharibacteria bacterium]|nr:metallopeptidase family protein [Candidatus Saccharibacteria bacterium]